MSWHYKYIDDHNDAYIESEKYQTAIEALSLIPGSTEATIYSRFDVATGGIHYYFSPAASQVAQAFGAGQCQKPSRDEIGGFFVGDNTLLSRLYP